ncbi:ABZJ_00895 family protein [Shewanella sp. YIC-542]|uniref:ABZJ_00895 family protein n=1 Tax=Shewanella mytili TaxID=3377111 RepID=UPI00398F4FAE
MSILGFFTRFTIVYTLVMAAVGITMGLLGVENANSLNTPILLAISFWCFYSYSTKNSRIIEGGEKWKLVFSALAGDVLASVLLGVPTMIANEVPIKFLFVGMAVVIPLHALLFVAVNYGVKKHLLKKRPELVQS